MSQQPNRRLSFESGRGRTVVPGFRVCCEKGPGTQSSDDIIWLHERLSLVYLYMRFSSLLSRRETLLEEESFGTLEDSESCGRMQRPRRHPHSIGLDIHLDLHEAAHADLLSIGAECACA